MKDEALKLALEALKLLPPLAWTPETAKRNYEAITAIKEALAQVTPLPVQPERQPLTDEWIRELEKEAKSLVDPTMTESECLTWLVRKVEDAHGIKGEA